MSAAIRQPTSDGRPSSVSPINMIKVPYRIAGLLTLLAAAKYFKDQLQDPSIISSIAPPNSAAQSADGINVIPYSSRHYASLSATIDGHSSKGEKFKWFGEIQDWLLSGEDAQEHNQASLDTRDLCIWPEELNCSSDRIINQIELKPWPNEQRSAIKVGLAEDFDQAEGSKSFANCNFNRCQTTRNLYDADAIVFRDADVSSINRWPRLEESKYRQKQIWIAYLLESPPNTFDQRFVRYNRDGRRPFNWTATYRSDSDIVTPYSKFVPYEDSSNLLQALKKSKHNEPILKLSPTRSQDYRKHLDKKQAKVAWFVSNCHSRNNRLEYARELSKYIQVDVYGKCGNFTCSKWSQQQCLNHINRNYKFYLSFENSNNRDYISEKLYRNALGYNDAEHALLPVVMGASKSDYQRLAPPNSFIHVDDFQSAKQLARFLNELSSDQAAYSAYFRWKSLGRFIDTKFLCRVCALLHRARYQQRVKIYDNLRDWWLND